MIARVLLCLLLVQPLHLGAAPAARALTLAPQAMVAGTRYSLAELIEPTDAPAAQFAAIDLGPAPLPGYTTRVTRAELARTLRARGLNVTLTGASAVSIERLTAPVAGDAAQDVAERYLQQRWQGAERRLVITLAAPLPELQLPAGSVQFRVRPLPEGAPLQRQQTLWLDVLVAHNFVRTMALRFELHAYQSALVASQALAAGSTPPCSAFTRRETEVTALAVLPLADCQALGAPLLRAVAAGSALLPTQLAPVLAVVQGDSVALRIADGAIEIEARATALSDGQIGQRIDVKPASSTAAVHTIVIGPGLVKLTGT